MSPKTFCQDHFSKYMGIMVLFCLASLIFPTLTSASEKIIESFFWPPGHFHQFNKISPSQRNHILEEIEKKLSSLRREHKSLLVKGEVVDKLRTDVNRYNPATILDQSGLIILVHNFPNIYCGFSGPKSLLNRNTFLLIKNPRVDRLESMVRQGFVITGHFLAFSQKYLEALSRGLQDGYRQPERLLNQRFPDDKTDHY
ncbi:MAG TPA: hypothetical protein DCY27_08130 [Desulfobacterales bacterium]|nr:hypothetical protein [Desulfobacterales bacterium]